MASVFLYWVVQRDAKTGELLTFKSFADYQDAERHKAQLEEVGAADEQMIELSIETLPILQSPK